MMTQVKGVCHERHGEDDLKVPIEEELASRGSLHGFAPKAPIRYVIHAYDPGLAGILITT